MSKISIKVVMTPDGSDHGLAVECQGDRWDGKLSSLGAYVGEQISSKVKASIPEYGALLDQVAKLKAQLGATESAKSAVGQDAVAATAHAQHKTK